MGDVLPFSWPTEHAADPLLMPAKVAPMLPAFRAALNVLPERGVVALALTQPSLLNLSTEQAKELQPLAAERYRLMAANSEYASAPSQLAYCFNAQKPKHGRALARVPEGAGRDSPVIVFLHGYGGSFLWYQHWLSEVFPRHVIICPAWGISTAQISPVYVDECLSALWKKTGWTPRSKPVLIELSAGGYGACQVVAAAAGKWSQLICLASPAPEGTAGRLGPTMPSFLAGGAEPWVKSGVFAKSLAEVRRSSPKARGFLIPQAGHFFLLTHPTVTRRKLEEWLGPP